MITGTIFPGKYIQGCGAIRTVGAETAKFGKKGFFLCARSAFKNILPALRAQAENKFAITAEKFGGESTVAEMERVCALVRASGADFIAGIGGGKTLDTAKAAADKLSLPVVIIPTIASTDAPCSAVSVFYTPEGLFDHYIKTRRNPDLVIVDTEIIARAPVRFLVSGMGDALSTWFEAEACKRKYAPNLTGFCGSMTAYALAQLCYDTLLEQGLLAKTACRAQAVTPALENIVEANTLLSGLGFESGGLAAAHSIHNGLTALPQTRKFYHGEKVAFGTLTSLFLSDTSAELMDEVFSFCEDVGLPTTLAELGLAGVSDEELKKVAAKTCEPGSDIFHEPAPVTAEAVFYALKAANAEGMRRKEL